MISVVVVAATIVAQHVHISIELMSVRVHHIMFSCESNVGACI